MNFCGAQRSSFTYWDFFRQSNSAMGEVEVSGSASPHFSPRLRVCDSARKAAAKREAWEEVRLDLNALRPLGIFETNLEYKHDTVHTFLATTLRDKPILRRGEIIAFGWFPKDDLPHEISINSQKTLELLQAYSHKN